jgi:hypothetical protein
MKEFIRHRLIDLLNESKNDEHQYQIRDIGGSDVYYKKKKKDKYWEFIDKEEFDKKTNKNNKIKFKNENVN